MFGEIIFFYIVLVLVMVFIAKKIKDNKANRIIEAFDGELGDRMKMTLPIDAINYCVDTHAITWTTEDGIFQILSFSSLGFRALPENFEYVVCKWIRDNIVYDSENYHLESMSSERDRYEKSGKATIKRNYIDEYTITEEPGRYVTTKISIGHALVHNGYNWEGYKVNTKPLKKW